MRRAALACIVVLGGCGGRSATARDMAPGRVDLAAGASVSRSGRVAVVSFAGKSPQGTPTQGYAVSAAFTVGTASDAQCTTTMMGGCAVRSCVRGRRSDGGAGGTAIAASAGVITVAGGAMPVALVPAGDRTYATLAQAGPLFSPGQTVRVSLAGADVPAGDFAVRAPPPPVITSPSPSPSAPLAIARATDFVASWTGGGDGLLRLALTVPPPSAAGAPYGDLDCAAPAAGGSVTIPAAALSRLPAGPADFTFTAELDGGGADGAWTVTVAAGTWPLDPDGKTFLGGTAMLD